MHRTPFCFSEPHNSHLLHGNSWSSLIAGLDCGLDRWTGLLDWIAGLDSEERCQTSMQDCMCSEDLCLARSYGRS